MCFSLSWIEQVCVYVVVVIAVIAILRILLPWLAAQLPDAGGVIVAVINVVLWAVVAIFVIYFCFALISCLISGGGLPLLPHR